MKKLWIAIVAVGVAGTVGSNEAERRAGAMVEGSAALAEEGRYEEAIADLETVRDWLGWTDAADGVEQALEEVYGMARLRGAEHVLPASERMDRRMRRGREAQAEFSRQNREGLEEWREQRGLPEPMDRREIHEQAERERDRPVPLDRGHVREIPEEGVPGYPPR